MTDEETLKKAMEDANKPVEIRSWSDGKLGFDPASTEQGDTCSIINFHKMRAYPVSVSETAEDALTAVKRKAKARGYYLTGKVTDVASVVRNGDKTSTTKEPDKVLVEMYMRDIACEEGDLAANIRKYERKAEQRKALPTLIYVFESELHAALVKEGRGALGAALREGAEAHQSAKAAAIKSSA